MLKVIFSLFFTLTISHAATVFSQQVAPKILGGSTASNGEWPWMVGLVSPVLTRDFRCGGSLIDKDWVLTAAHCVNGLSSRNLKIFLNQENVFADFYGTVASDVQLIDVALIVKHPSYRDGYNKRTRSNFENDIALLNLAESVNITPVETLPAYSNQANEGRMVTALGWGYDSQTGNTIPGKLLKTELPIVNQARCDEAISEYSLLDTMFCAGYEQGEKDTCEGDSGGPLVVFDQESQSWRQAGITSWGADVCGTQGLYGIYTRVNLYQNFINKYLCSADDIPPAPKLILRTEGNLATADWSSVDVFQNLAPSFSKGYRLDFAPYPNSSLITTIDLKLNQSISAQIPPGSHYFVAVHAYNGNCVGPYSNVEILNIP